MTDVSYDELRDWQDVVALLPRLGFEDGPCGGALIVYHQGQRVIQSAFGQANRHSPWCTDTLSVNFSIGKGVLSTLIAVLVSRGILSYGTPISEYWMKFGLAGKHNLTLMDVLTHTAGLFDVTSIISTNDAVLDWASMLDRVAAMPIAVPKGQSEHNYASSYSALVSGWVLGGAIEHATGKPLQVVLEEYLAEPLGLVGELYYGLPREMYDRLAVPYRLFDGMLRPRTKPTLKPDSAEKKAFFANLPFAHLWRADELTTQTINKQYFDTAQLNLVNYKHALIPDGKTPLDYHHPDYLGVPIPGANGVSTANALATIYAMHANDGVHDGQTIIDQETLKRLRCVYTQGLDAVMPADMAWRLGFHRLFSVQPSTEAYGHMGYNGSVAFCDPRRRLAVAFIHNFDTTMLNDVRQFIITEAVLQVADQLT